MPAKTILLVEDDPAVREALEQALAFENYQVVPACDPQQAMRRFAENHIDIALLDLNLGVETGWDTFQRLANLRPRLPIIVMSGRPDQFSHASARNAAGLMEKPLDLSYLFQKLAALSP